MALKQEEMDLIEKVFWSGITLSAFGFVAFIFYWLFFLNHLEPNQLGVVYNSMDGTVTTQEQPGWHRTSPFTRVAYIDMRPFQVCMGGGARIVNCKLLRFNKDGVQEFVKMQGFEYWSAPSSVCFTFGPDTQRCGGFANIMAGYAFSNSPVPFLDVVEEMKGANSR